MDFFYRTLIDCNLGAIWKLHLRPLKRESRTRSSQEECQAAKPPTWSQPRSRPAQLLQLPRPRPAQHLQQQLPRSPSVWSRRGGPSHPLPRQEVLRPEKLLPLSVSLWSCWLCCSPPSHSPSSYVAGSLSHRTHLSSQKNQNFCEFFPKESFPYSHYLLCRRIRKLKERQSGVRPKIFFKILFSPSYFLFLIRWGKKSCSEDFF